MSSEYISEKKKGSKEGNRQDSREKMEKSYRKKIKGNNKERNQGHSKTSSYKSSRENSRESIIDAIHGNSKSSSAESLDAYITDENGNYVKLPKPDVNSNMVYLNIYDLDSVSKVVNSVARTMGTGAFHAGVEVYGHEYSFGYIVDGETGVTKTKARCHPYHVYRETIPMGKTPLTKEEVDILVEVMKMQWIGDTYDLLSRNCLNYADYFCNLLDVGGVPDWVMSLQKRITWMKSNISVAATKLKALNKAAGIPSVLKFLKKKSKDGEDFEGCKVIIKS